MVLGIWRRMQLFIACVATVLATFTILSVILILIAGEYLIMGGADLIPWFFLLYFIVGGILSYKFLWPFYSKNLKLPIED